MAFFDREFYSAGLSLGGADRADHRAGSWIGRRNSAGAAVPATAAAECSALCGMILRTGLQDVQD